MVARQVLILDLDGTIVDSAPGIVSSLTHAVRSLGHDFLPTSKTVELLGPPMRWVVGQLLDPFGDTRIEECVNIYREHYREHGLFESIPYEGIDNVLATLAAADVDLFIATSKREAFAQSILKHHRLRDYFINIYGTPPDGGLDDKSALVEYLVISESLSSRSARMVGDKADDIVAALKNNLMPVGALWGYGGEKELTDAGAELLLDEPQDLLRLMLQSV